jgi:hypothetical protein
LRRRKYKSAPKRKRSSKAEKDDEDKRGGVTGAPPFGFIKSGATTMAFDDKLAQRTRKTLSPKHVRKLALALPEAQESSHQGHPDFRVRNKIFATLPPDGRTAVLKITPADLDDLIQRDAETFRDIWGGRWLSVNLDRVAPEALQKLLVDSWRLAAPKTLMRAYDTNNPPIGS